MKKFFFFVLLGITFKLFSQNPSPLDVSPKSLNFKGEFVFLKDHSDRPIIYFKCTNNSGYNLSNISFTFFRETLFSNKVETMKCPYVWNSNVYFYNGIWYRNNNDYSLIVVPDNYKWEKGDKITIEYDGMYCRSWYCDKELDNKALVWIKKNWTQIPYDDLIKLGKDLKRIK